VFESTLAVSFKYVILGYACHREIHPAKVLTLWLVEKMFSETEVLHNIKGIEFKMHTSYPHLRTPDETCIVRSGNDIVQMCALVHFEYTEQTSVLGWWAFCTCI
jgi:hypothetical protein